MKVSLISETEIAVSALNQPGLEGAALDSVQLLACAIASCTHVTLATYGERFDTSADDMHIIVKWHLGSGPKRVEAVNLDVHWPSLPESRLDAATRAAKHCTLHATLSHGAEVDTFVDH